MSVDRRVVLTTDSLTGKQKERTIYIGSDMGRPVLVNESIHQHHSIRLDTGGSDDDGTVRIAEHWKTGAYRQHRVLDLTEVVHLLLNISAEEIAEISARPSDYVGLSTEVRANKE